MHDVKSQRVSLPSREVRGYGRERYPKNIRIRLILDPSIGFRGSTHIDTDLAENERAGDEVYRSKIVQQSRRLVLAMMHLFNLRLTNILPIRPESLDQDLVSNSSYESHVSQCRIIFGMAI